MAAPGGCLPCWPVTPSLPIAARAVRPHRRVPGANASASTSRGCACRRCWRRPTTPPTKPADLAASQPLNLAAVLFNRAVLEQRTPGRTPEAILGFARPAYLFAVQTRRVLQAEDMIDLELKRIAWRARLLIVDALAELAPEVEGELLFALAARLAGRAARPDRPAGGRARSPGRRLLRAMRQRQPVRRGRPGRALDARPRPALRGRSPASRSACSAPCSPSACCDSCTNARCRPRCEAFERLEAESRQRLDDPAAGRSRPRVFPRGAGACAARRRALRPG